MERISACNTMLLIVCSMGKYSTMHQLIFLIVLRPQSLHLIIWPYHFKIAAYPAAESSFIVDPQFIMQCTHTGALPGYRVWLWRVAGEAVPYVP